MLRQLLTFLTILTAVVASRGEDFSQNHSLALRNIERCMALLDACESTSLKGSASNYYLADNYDTRSHKAGGPSDVWPYTAAIEAHCSLLEALGMVRDSDPEFYDAHAPRYLGQLERLIDNLEWYRGTYQLASYATTGRAWSPYAVPRAGSRGGANVTGILNVYDDQMWLCRELIRAWRLTGTNDWLELARYLADYIINGWDCWRDADGNEYGGITWGPGYNSKHACSNGPAVQPLAWLAAIYADSKALADYYYRDETNTVRHELRPLSDHYLDFAAKIYNFHKRTMANGKGVYWDMLGAVSSDVKVSRGYRQHVDTGGPVGNFYSYNTGTMISGAAELYRLTGDAAYLADLQLSTQGAWNEFATYKRAYQGYIFRTDATAAEGFSTWFNDVLMRSYVDAIPYETDGYTDRTLNAFQAALDYAFEHHNRDNLLPVNLYDGWGTETLTKAFHQYAFASEYALLAVRLLDDATGAVGAVGADSDLTNTPLYNLNGVCVGTLSPGCEPSVVPGIYVSHGRKIHITH